MELFVWLEVMPHQVELKCAIITHGEQCVMIYGVSRMLEWCADNLDYHHHVSISTRLPNIGSVHEGQRISTYIKTYLALATIYSVVNSSPGSDIVLFYISYAFQLQLQHQMQDMVRG